MMVLTSHRIQNTSNEAWKQAKSKKRQKIYRFSGFAAITKSKNRKVPLSHRGINIFQNPFNTIFVNLTANLLDTGKVKRGLGEENLRFLVFFFADLVVLRLSQRKKSKNAISRRIIIFTRTTLKYMFVNLNANFFEPS